jgi:hypothetical protein
MNVKKFVSPCALLLFKFGAINLAQSFPRLGVKALQKNCVRDKVRAGSGLLDYGYD